MSRKPKPLPTATDERLKLIEALKFAAIATKDDDKNYTHQFVAIQDHWLLADNGIFTLGINVDIALELCPQAEQFRAALQQCGQQFQLTQLDKNSVSIRSGNFRALVPALDNGALSILPPDAPCALINNHLADAFKSCLTVMSKGDRIYNTSVLLRANSMTATNGGLAIEYWHGIDLPGPLNIPKRSVETIVKLGKPLAKFGFSANSVTFYFEDNSWLRTRLIEGEWPDVGRLFDKISIAPKPIWPEFYVGLKAIGTFIQNDRIFFHDNYLASHQSLDLGANYCIPGLPGGYSFSAAYWRIMEPYIKALALTAPDAPVSFIGDNTRGLLMGKSS